MALSERQLALVRTSFAALKDDPKPKSIEFYEALFRYAPELREMFREDLAGQGMRFMSTLGVMVNNLHHPEAMSERYASLGEGHKALGVTAEHFEPMGRALIDTLKSTLGEAFTDEMEEAWTLAYAEVARRVIETGDIPEK